MKITIEQDGKEPDVIDDIDELALVTYERKSGCTFIRTLGDIAFTCLAGALLQKKATDAMGMSEENEETED